MQGYIKDHRQELLSDVWSMPPLYHRLWQWLKYKANHEDVEIPMNDGTRLKILRGQHLTSVRKIANGIGWYERVLWKEPNPKTVSEVLKWLSDNGMIRVESGNRQFTLITLINYDFFNAKDDESNAKVTASIQSLDINKNEKNDKNKRLKDSSSRNKKSTYSEDSPYYRMAKYFLDKVNEMAKEECLTHLIVNVNLQSWANDFRLLEERDNHMDRHLIKAVMDWVVTDSFWYKNCLSAKSFRKHFPKLVLEMRKRPATASMGSKRDRNKQLLQQKMKEATEFEQSGDDPAAGTRYGSLPDGGAF